MKSTGIFFMLTFVLILSGQARAQTCSSTASPVCVAPGQQNVQVNFGSSGQCLMISNNGSHNVLVPNGCNPNDPTCSSQVDASGVSKEFVAFKGAVDAGGVPGITYSTCGKNCTVNGNTYANNATWAAGPTDTIVDLQCDNAVVTPASTKEVCTTTTVDERKCVKESGGKSPYCMAYGMVPTPVTSCGWVTVPAVTIPTWIGWNVTTWKCNNGTAVATVQTPYSNCMKQYSVGHICGWGSNCECDGRGGPSVAPAACKKYIGTSVVGKSGIAHPFSDSTYDTAGQDYKVVGFTLGAGTCDGSCTSTCPTRVNNAYCLYGF